MKESLNKVTLNVLFKAETYGSQAKAAPIYNIFFYCSHASYFIKQTYRSI